MCATECRLAWVGWPKRLVDSSKRGGMSCATQHYAATVHHLQAGAQAWLVPGSGGSIKAVKGLDDAGAMCSRASKVLGIMH